MRIEKKNLLGNPFIGVFGTTNNNITLLPSGASEKFKKLTEETLETEIVSLNLSNSSLIGLFSLMNDKGIVVPETVYDSEIKLLKEHFDNVGIVSDFTAIANLASCNNKSCIASTCLSKETANTIQETLDVSLTQTTLANTEVVGSCLLITDNGFLANPNISDEELQKIRKTLGLDGNVGSINYGTPFIKGGLIANKKGAIVGLPTTAYELGRIDEALFLGRE